MHADAALDDPSASEELAYALALTVAAAARPTAPRMPAARTRRIEELIHWLEQEPEAPLSLADLAQYAALSPFHLLREFKCVAGVTPYQFVLSLRLRRAADLLRRSRVTVLEAALASGFSDLSEFGRRFRRTMGMPPGQFRRRHGLPPS